jgi:hypothetical protein
LFVAVMGNQSVVAQGVITQSVINHVS